MSSNDSHSADESNPLLGPTRHSNYTNNVNESENLCSYWTQALYNVLIHICVSGLTSFVIYICFYQGMVLFSWHPTLMLLGFLVLMTEAMLTFNPINLPTRELGYRSRVFVHWNLQVLATCAITAGFNIIVLNKIRIGKNHFTSNHGIVGLTTVILASISVAFGVLSKFSYQFRHYLRPLNMKMIHSTLALCCYILALTTISLGLLSSWFLENVSYNWVYALITVVSFKSNEASEICRSNNNSQNTHIPLLGIVRRRYLNESIRREHSIFSKFLYFLLIDGAFL